MRTRTQRGVAGAATAVLLVTAGCTSGGSWSDGAGPDPSLPMSEVSAITDGDVIRLSWAPVADADRYRFSDGAYTTDVPATICGEQCALTIADPPPRAQVAVSAVRADGTFSAAATTPVTAPGAPGGAVAVDEPAVLLVHNGAAYGEAVRPRVEVVPVDSADAAQQLIDDAYRSGSGVLSASLNLPAGQLAGPPPRLVSQPAAGPPADATWQVEAMRFDLRPGDPPGDGIVVATIEGGGVATEHPSLRGVVADGHHVDAPAGEGNGVTDPTVHATGVASLIAGQPAGDVPGIAPGARIHPVDIGDRRESDLIEGIIAAVDAGADIINVSMAVECRSVLGITRCPDGIQAATDYAEREGVVVVAGAGNNGSGDQCGGEPNADQWPAVLDTVISVGAYEPTGVVWPCTPYRPDLDVLAPGVRLLLAEPGGGYAIGSGASFAAPLVSGLIAVLLAERPQLTPAEIRELLPQWLRPNQELDVAAALTSLPPD
ncbi:S8 family serine peptidase [Natronosporangium hydrolyticum]|uniref:S8 family serine peptidase n=1 Tax=Natronosporangium hydrolyticum TaxID=2811111 RepID=A0A895YKH4_9ACTN|nr:S8 family serine peptidase [Natronosporangium hydrolyticum]QSB15813.1 S8 family serine peptidase [Natronosporangium hydrolyticum]